jgi:hypothetical protein
MALKKTSRLLITVATTVDFANSPRALAQQQDRNYLIAINFISFGIDS